MHRRPGCPVNDKAEANRSHSRRKRATKMEDVSSFMIRSRWKDKRVCCIKILPERGKFHHVDNQSLFQH